MDASELPMILFTVLAQMCVGAFIVLGVGQFVGLSRFSQRVVDRVTDPTVYVIGPALVLGLIASMFHMHDVFHVLNVFRHLGSSWLSREVTFGILFAGAGFVFAVLQWFKWGPSWLRRVLAVVTALFGIALVYSMTMIYSTLRAVPAWATWATPLQFWATTVLLGAMLVGVSFMASSMLGGRIKLGRATGPVDEDEVRSLTRVSLRWLTVVVLVAAGTILVGLPLHIAQLASQGGVALQSAETYATPLFGIRLALLVIGACVVGLFVYVLASRREGRPSLLMSLAMLGFVLVLAGEFMGRAQFYESMLRVGI